MRSDTTGFLAQSQRFGALVITRFPGRADANGGDTAAARSNRCWMVDRKGFSTPDHSWTGAAQSTSDYVTHKAKVDFYRTTALFERGSTQEPDEHQQAWPRRRSHEPLSGSRRSTLMASSTNLRCVACR